ncbi:MAG TPA: low molecular weight phosphatase family protein [Thermoplasmata archaeon]|nr:low molecular weight phosphatase family protein [Thermoplasmata archaeon]
MSPELLRVLLMAGGTVLFVCVANAGRSLMAEAIFNADPPAGWIAVSAGTRPASAANPRTLRMLHEIGVAPPAHGPQALTPQLMEGARLRVTMGCLDDASCPAQLKSLELRDWALPDPGVLDDEGFRGVRDEIRRRVARLRVELGGTGSGRNPT